VDRWKRIGRGIVVDACRDGSSRSPRTTNDASALLAPPINLLSEIGAVTNLPAIANAVLPTRSAWGTEFFFSPAETSIEGRGAACAERAE
jgi:hypothetical protein